MKRIKISIIFPIIALITISDLWAVDTEKDFSRKSVESFVKFYETFVPEKLYLHTDKPFYSAGEKIWYKGYLLDAITLTREKESRFIYVELIDSRSNVVSHHKIKADDNLSFHNSIELDPSLPEGEYMLRAYTLWMLNDKPENFFSKNITIKNPIDNRVFIDHRFVKTSDNSAQAGITFTNSLMEPAADMKVSVSTTDRPNRQSTYYTNSAGYISVPIDISDEGKTRNLILAFGMDGYEFKRVIPIPIFSNDFDLQFFPEGGSLLPGNIQHVAFKATGVDGLGISIKGELAINDSLIVEIKTDHNGMGRFGMIPTPGAVYRIIATSDAGVTKNFTLPVAASGCSISAVTTNGVLLYDVHTTSDIVPDRLGIIIISRGKLIYAADYDKKRPGMISLSALQPGVTQLCLVDNHANRILSKRSVFVRSQNPVNIEHRYSGRISEPRELVEVELIFTQENDDPVSGVLSAAVTDASVIDVKSTDENMLSYMLLSSELEGYIEDAGYYFIDDNQLTNYHLDLVMMTHGWTRYNIEAILEGSQKQPVWFKEDSQFISGKVETHLGGAARNAQLALIIPQTGFMEVVPLEKDNRFIITGLDIPDSTSLIVQSMNRSGKTGRNELILDKIDYPAPSFHSLRPRYDTETGVISEDYLQKSLAKYLADGGMSIHEIETIIVRGTKGISIGGKISTSEIGIPYRASATLTSEDLASYSSIWDAILRFPGAQEMPVDFVYGLGTGAENRGMRQPLELSNAGMTLTDKVITIRRELPIIFYNNVVIDILSLHNYNIADVEYIDLLRGVEAASFGMGPIGTAIIIKSKSYETLLKEGSLPQNFHTLTDLGYKLPDQFYQPKYEVPENMRSTTVDHRTTIGWFPNLVTDNQGKATIAFYTADSPADYRVVVEGITDDGELYFDTFTLQR